ncbi:MAG: AMP-binding protein, partial [Oleispira sp.]|nr:AMP-binding protein [Oleispira sp.]
AKEYYNNAKANEETFIDGWFYSGDIAVVDEDGYIQIKDRKKELIHVTTAYGWENVSSLEIEAAISQVPCIIDVAVVGALLEGGDHLVIAFFEAKDVDFDVSVMLEKYCEKILVSYKVPRYFFEYKLPKTETGKIRKNILQGIALDKISSKKAQCVAGYLEPEV